MRAALYMRLSNDDAGKTGSDSIANQRSLLRHHASENSSLAGWDLVEFEDDGCSGTNMQRPGLDAMLAMICRGKINCVIVKDFSRLGRSYIEVSRLIEEFLPRAGVRLISLGDNYDSRNGHNGELDTALRALIYDLYSKDLSVKVKSSLQTRRQRGAHLAGPAPYGYRRVSGGGLEVDEKTAGVVRRIFDMATRGESCAEIARALNHEQTKPRGRAAFWRRSDISGILRDETYVGAAVSGKTRRPVVGGPSIKIAIKEWTVIADANPRIVSKKLFDEVNRRHSRAAGRAKHVTGDNKKILIRCANCGMALRRTGKPPMLRCETPTAQPLATCGTTTAPAQLIEQTAIEALNSIAALFAQKDAKSLGEEHKKPPKNNTADFEIYEDFKSGKLSKAKYLALKSQPGRRHNNKKPERPPHNSTTLVIDCVILHNVRRIELRLKRFA